MNPLANQIFGGSSNMQNMIGGNQMQLISNIMRMAKSKSPEQIFVALMQSNPQFSQFMQSVKGKTPEQVAKENGIDLNQIMGQFK